MGVAMLKISSTLAAALGAVSLSVAAMPAQAQSGGDLNGVWRNPKNSVHVGVRPCGLG